MSSAGQAGGLNVRNAVQKSEAVFRRLQTSTKYRAVLSKLDSLEPRDRPKTRPKQHIKPGEVTALKDNFVTTDLPTTCASYILQGFKGPSKSTVATLLENAGIRVVAKTNMDEFGMGSHSTNSAWGAVKHGSGTYEQSAGGSSGGSAIVVAAELARVAIGSDTGGSVRLPAAYTGIFGFKPSYGCISRNGLIPYANSLDTVGLMARSVVDIISLYRILDKPDPADPTCLTTATRTRIRHALLTHSLPKGEQLAEQVTDGVRVRVIGDLDQLESAKLSTTAKRKMAKLNKRYFKRGPTYRIGVPEEYNILEIHPLVRQAWQKTLSYLAEMGNEIVSISLPNTRQALAAYYVLAPAEASSNLAKYDGVRYGIPRSSNLPDNHNGPLYSHYRGEYFGDEVKRRILLGTFSLSAGAMDNYFIQAQKVRRLVQQDFNSVFALGHPLIHSTSKNAAGVDFIVVPTAPTPPPLLSEVQSQSPLDSYINDVFTVPASLAGLPAISVPIHADDEITQTPDKNVGMQVIGQFGDDMAMLKLTRELVTAMTVPKLDQLRIWTRERM